MHCSASQNVRLCLLRCSTFFYAKGLYCESTTMRLSHSYPLSTSVEQTAPQASGEQITPLQMAPGQGLWCHLEAGSTLHCTGGRLQINSPWSYALKLSAGDAPYCNGAHAGWHWLEAEGSEPVQLHFAERAYAGWHGAWESLARWVGWQR